MKDLPPIGVIQGRLSRPRHNRIQSFPGEEWEREFELAGELGLDRIEMVFDEADPESHPLMSPSGLEKLRQCVLRTGVQVRSLCADYFMFFPLHRGDSERRSASLAMLSRLLVQCAKAGIRDVVLPCVDQASLGSPQEEELLRACLREVHPLLGDGGTHLVLETDMAPARFRDFLNGLELPLVQVNYDIGNSASLGFDPAEELSAYGDRICTVHVKDRMLGGTTVPLGQGCADFERIFSGLARLGYPGPFILQGARSGDEVECVRSYADFVRDLLREHFHGPRAEG